MMTWISSPACNPGGSAFLGSNPRLPTILIERKTSRFEEQGLVEEHLK